MTRWAGAVAVASAAALAGCVGTTVSAGRWVKPEVEQAELLHDQYECQRLATLAAPSGGGERQARFDDCMRARGYRRRP